MSALGSTVGTTVSPAAATRRSRNLAPNETRRNAATGKKMFPPIEHSTNEQIMEMVSMNPIDVMWELLKKQVLVYVLAREMQKREEQLLEDIKKAKSERFAEERTIITSYKDYANYVRTSAKVAISDAIKVLKKQCYEEKKGWTGTRLSLKNKNSEDCNLNLINAYYNRIFSRGYYSTEKKDNKEILKLLVPGAIPYFNNTIAFLYPTRDNKHRDWDATDLGIFFEILEKHFNEPNERYRMRLGKTGRNLTREQEHLELEALRPIGADYQKEHEQITLAEKANANAKAAEEAELRSHYEALVTAAKIRNGISEDEAKASATEFLGKNKLLKEGKQELKEALLSNNVKKATLAIVKIYGAKGHKVDRKFAFDQVRSRLAEAALRESLNVNDQGATHAVEELVDEATRYNPQSQSGPLSGSSAPLPGQSGTSSVVSSSSSQQSAAAATAAVSAAASATAAAVSAVGAATAAHTGSTPPRRGLQKAQQQVLQAQQQVQSAQQQVQTQPAAAAASAASAATAASAAAKSLATVAKLSSGTPSASPAAAAAGASAAAATAASTAAATAATAAAAAPAAAAAAAAAASAASTLLPLPPGGAP